MAASFLTRAALQQISQRVLSNVLEQLPQRMAGRRADGTGTELQAGELPQINALGLAQLQARVAEHEEQVENMNSRLARVERQLGWRSTVRLAAIGIFSTGLGFLIAIAIGALGWVR